MQVLLLIPCAIASAEVIDVEIKGVDDGVRTTRQQDYIEALVNAKLQAIELAGVEIESITRVVDLQVQFQLVEQRSNGVLLPGFRVIDIGYVADGTYQIVLIGKVRGGSEPDRAAREKSFEAILPIDESYVVIRAARVYERPSLGAKVVTILREGDEVLARGWSKDPPAAADKWYFIEQGGKELGFVFGRYIEMAESYHKRQTAAEERARQEDARRKREQVERESEERLNRERGR